MKKLLALLLALVMVLGLFAGCGNTDAPAETKAPAAETPDETKAPEVEAPVEDEPKYDPDAVLTWYFMGDEHADNQMVFDAANELIKAELGFTVKFMPVGAGEYQEKINLAINGGDPWDICWTSNWRNNILQNVEREAFLPLDDLIAQHPELVDAIAPGLWEAGKIGGVTYGITCQQICARCCSVAVPAIYSDLYDEKTAGGVNKYSDLTAYMAAVAEEHPAELTTGMVSDLGELGLLWGWEWILGTGYPVAIDMTADKVVAFNPFATEEFKDAVFTRWQWVQDGITLPGASNKEQAEWHEWEKPLEISTYTPGYVNDTMMGTAKFEVTMKPESDVYVTFGSVAATMMAVNAETEYPEECVAFLAFLNTSTELMDLLTYGIEDVHYTRDAEGKVTKVEDAAYGNSGWRVGNTFILSLTSNQTADAVAATAALNEAGKASPLAGYTPDLSAIELELTNCRTVYEEYCIGLFEEGLSKDVQADWDAFQAKMEEAGVQKVLAEIQAQIDAYLGQ